MRWWCADDALMMHWWCSDDALMMHGWCADDASRMRWWCMSVIFDILEPSAFQKYSTCMVFYEFCLCLCLSLFICLCLCLCLCLEVDSRCRNEQGTSQHVYINTGILNLYTLTHSSWNFFLYLSLYLSLSLYSSSLYDRRHRPHYGNISYEGSGMILGWFIRL